jgi:hypothetical protein
VTDRSVIGSRGADIALWINPPFKCHKNSVRFSREAHGIITVYERQMMHRERCREVELVFCISTRVTDVTEDGFKRPVWMLHGME